MPEWLWAIIITIVVSLLVYIWQAHEARDKERNDAIWDQIGRDSHSGMRKILHDTRNKLSLMLGHKDLKDRDRDE